MAEIDLGGGQLTVRLSRLERLGALRGDVAVALADVAAVRAVDDPWAELRGVRAPGTGVPGVIALGTRRGGFGRDFAAVYGHNPGIVVELAHGPFGRLVISTRAATDWAARIDRARAGS